MARATIQTKQLAASSSTAIATAQTLLAAGAFTLNGAAVTAGVATLDTQRRVGFLSVRNDTGITFTVKGTDGAGVAISETLTGTNGGTAQTFQDFLTITAASASGATAGNVSIGTTNVGSTPWIVPDHVLVPAEIEIGLKEISGTTNVTVEATDDTPLPPLNIYVAGQGYTPPIPLPYGWPGLTTVAMTVNVPVYGDIDRTVAAYRLTVNNGTGQVQMTGRQAGLTTT